PSSLLSLRSSPSALSFLFSSPTARPPVLPLFPYTTLFRSPSSRAGQGTVLIRPRTGTSSCAASCSGPIWPRPLASSRARSTPPRSEEHTSELQSLTNLVCRLLLEKKKKHRNHTAHVSEHCL